MNWRHDPRLQKSLEKATLESLFKKYFQSIYGNDEVQEMENALRNALNKYEKKDTLFQVGLYIIYIHIMLLYISETYGDPRERSWTPHARMPELALWSKWFL